jgi:hypothetical protein
MIKEQHLSSGAMMLFFIIQMICFLCDIFVILQKNVLQLLRRLRGRRGDEAPEF